MRTSMARVRDIGGSQRGVRPCNMVFLPQPDRSGDASSGKMQRIGRASCPGRCVGMGFLAAVPAQSRGHGTRPSRCEGQQRLALFLTLVPKLCLGTHVMQNPFRGCPLSETEFR